MVCDHPHPLEERVEVGGDDLLDGHESLPIGEHHEPAEQRGHLDPSDPLLVARRVDHHHHQVEGEARDVGEGVTGVDGEGGQHREDPLLEDLVQVRPVVVVQARPVAEADAVTVEVGHQPVEEGARLPGVQLHHLEPDRPDLCLRSLGVGGGALEPRRELLEAAHPDLEELVQRPARDGQEARPLQQREALVLGLGQHPRVEVEPGELAVDQDVGDVERRQGGLGPVGRGGGWGRGGSGRAGKPGVRGRAVTDHDIQGGLARVTPIGTRHPGSRGHRAVSSRAFSWHLINCASPRSHAR